MKFSLGNIEEWRGVLLDRASSEYDSEFDFSLNVVEAVAVDVYRLKEIESLLDAGIMRYEGLRCRLKHPQLLAGWKQAAVKQSGTRLTSEGRSNRQLARKVIESLQREHDKYGHIPIKPIRLSRMTRATLYLLCFAGIVLVALVGRPVIGSRASAQPTACGVERWTVKTLQDRPRLLPVRATTIAYLVSRPAPHSPPDSRLPFERHVFRLTAAVTLDRPEDDGDLHLVLTEGARTMIAESPSPA